MVAFGDFKLVLNVVGDHLHVSLQSAPHGQGTTCSCPGSRLPLPGVKALDVSFQNLRESRDYELFQATRERLEIKLKEVGKSLYEALIIDEVRDLWAQCHGSGARSVQPLRLRLQMPIAGDEGALLHATPWECLWLPGRGFAAVDESLSLVRHVAGPGADVPPPQPQRMVVLVVASQAAGLPPLDLESEIDELFEAAGPRLHFERLDTPCLDHLRERLAGEAVHAVHFMGHGGLDDDGRQGLMMLEGLDGGTDEVPGERLANVLRPVPSLRLAVFNACHTAANVAGEPFAGIATAAIRLAGVPAVVAMQYPISDRDAVRFSSRLYRCLAEGRSLDEAVVEARRCLYHQGSPSWAVPVLFSRLEGGDLFAPPKRPARWKRWLAALVIAVAAFGGWELSPLWLDDLPSVAAPTRFDVVGPFDLGFDECRFYGRGDEAELLCRLTARNLASGSRELALDGDVQLTDTDDVPYYPSELAIGNPRSAAETPDLSLRRTLAPGEQVNVEIVFDTISRQKKKAGVLRLPLGDLGTAEFEAFMFERDD